MSRVVLAMSGGVDSSVAAHLLLERGHDVVGVFMRHGEQAIDACIDGHSNDRSPAAGKSGPGTDSKVVPSVTSGRNVKQGCCSMSDAQDARRVADQLDIPFFVLNFQAEFARIIDYFVNQYASGKTPNPCIVCNQWLKFGRLFDYADSVGADFVATGHYARRVTTDDGDEWLCRGVDHSKDQSYVLFGIDRSRLERMLLPVGNYHKSHIRKIALNTNLKVAHKRDSQDICFVPSGQHGSFVQSRCGHSDRSGKVITTQGEIVGQHSGIEFFTIGQRKGLGVAMGQPYFVVRIDPDTCEVTIGRREELARSELTARDLNWLAEPPSTSFRCHAKIRYNSAPAIATGHIIQGKLRIVFDEPRFGVAPGQAVVCYDGNRVLGGGWIE